MRVFLSLLLLVVAADAAAMNYKWVDPKGEVHYSDKPPPKGVESKELPTTSPEGGLEPGTVKIKEDPRLKNFAALPYVGESGREAYKAFLEKKSPRAFVICEDGTHQAILGTSEENLGQLVQKFVKDNMSRVCRPYVLNNEVVW
jgi:hypothetical protein